MYLSEKDHSFSGYVNFWHWSNVESGNCSGKEKREGEIHLEIIDDGKGLPENFSSNSDNGSLGLKLIHTLTRQLDGTYHLESPEKGTVFTLQFERDDVKGAGSTHF